MKEINFKNQDRNSGYSAREVIGGIALLALIAASFFLLGKLDSYIKYNQRIKMLIERITYLENGIVKKS